MGEQVPPLTYRGPQRRTGGQQPSQYALFVMKGRSLSGQVVWKADLTLEFLDPARNAVSPATRYVDWTRPRFQLHGLPTPIPAFVGRPGAQSYQQGLFYQAEIRPM